MLLKAIASMQTSCVSPSTSLNLNHSEAQTLLATLLDLRASVYHEGQQLYHQWLPQIQRRSFKLSALNLAYYLALRHHDLRQIQLALTAWGLSSLGRSELRVLPNLDAVIVTLGAICQTSALLPKRPPLRAFFRGDRLLEREITAVFGKPSTHRHGQIMVTLPTAAGQDPSLIKRLLLVGANVVRINCAHDDRRVWEMMITHLRQAEAETGKTCKVYMDLAGPKNRTGEVAGNQTRVQIGDRILLTRDHPQSVNSHIPFRVSCTLPEVLDQVSLNQSVWFDEGQIGSKIIDITPEGVLLEVTHTRPKGEKLRPDKGLNFPETVLTLDPLTPKDCQDLDFAAQFADIIGYSFVQTAADLQRLQIELAKRAIQGRPKLAIVAKVETQAAIRNLPEMIVQAAGQHPFGVMIARGDLAVEIGYQRLAEMQEEILWLCEAAHIPVIWATQVLENLVKTGIPSRAEITDAAMAERAECVMLNKGPFIIEAVQILDDVLTRMQAHQQKKTPQLRALHSW